MTAKQIVCLANSKKHGERCIAGIEVTPTPSGHHSIVRHADSPKWVRPVSNTSHGEVPAKVVRDIQLLDIIEFNAIEEVGNGYQSENVTFDENHVRVVRRLPKTREVLDQLVSKPGPTIFGNRGKAVSTERIHAVTHSLMLVRAENPDFHIQETSSGKLQVRATFESGSNRYDFPITDPYFEHRFSRSADFVKEFQSFYFTLSLGVEHEGWHYKLVAAVFGL